MKKWKAILAMVLALCLLGSLLAACASTTESAAEADNAAAETSATAAQDGEEEETASSEAADDDGELTDVIFWCMSYGAEYADRLNAAINEVTEPYGIHAEVTHLTIADFASSVLPALMSGERVDLMTYPILCNVTTMVQNGLAMDITDELNTYAPDAMELMQDYVEAYTFNGRVYGLPALRAYVSNGYFCFKQELLDGAGLTEKAKNMTTWSEFEEVLQGLYDAYAADGVYPVTASVGEMIATNNYYIHGDNFSDIEVVDTLGDTVKVVYTDKDGNVSNAKAKEEYVAACEKAKEWLDKGWLHPDGVFDSDWVAFTAIANGVAACEVIGSEIGVEATKTGVYGAQALCVKEYTGMIQTSTLTSWGIGVPLTCEEPEAACKLINLLYTNEDLMRILVNGIEGEDYEIVDGEAVSTSTFTGSNFVQGNNFLTVPLQGAGADLYELAEAENKAAECSAFLGFTIDSKELELLISQISAVNDQYTCMLSCGAYTEEAYQEYLSKLEGAGVQEYLDAVQAQLDAWKASK